MRSTWWQLQILKYQKMNSPTKQQTTKKQTTLIKLFRNIRKNLPNGEPP